MQLKRRFRVTGYLPNTVYRFAASAANSAGAGPESVPRTVFYVCSNGFRDTGAGCQCPAIANCETYAKGICACSKCKQYFTTASTGSSCKCAPLANCKTYSQVDCKCTQCNSGWGNCDGKDNTGCETPLNSSSHCGSCNAKCTLANAMPRCDRGTCRIASCLPGWGDCDLKPSNGCETAINTTERCGSCTNKCSLLRATATCAGGTCKVASCDAGWGDCDLDPSNGCETQLTTTTNCAACNTTCALDNATPTCGSGTCSIDSCTAGWGDCDLDPSNGCETRLNTTTNCAACNTTCALDNATPTCGSGTCSIDSCTAGWGDCDLDPSNGCETRLNTTTNCAACNTTCALDNATPTCGSGTCSIDSCAAGDNFSDQLGNAAVSDSDIPIRVEGELRFKQISAGDYHTCGITASDRAVCWGYNYDGQLGDGTNTDSQTPVSVSADMLFQQISVGEVHTCALNITGHAFCWGGNYFGALGDGTQDFPNSNTPVSVAGGKLFTQISVADYHAVALVRSSG
ncbi:Tryptophan synthase alpha chain [Chlorella sorokiniana]|uniref:Tryptophan synthase alpha chain n=1 Tax=Chlorella sorokiniana TaxID=3076 RepID=A0A2P6TR75_CHLSO|nr:Tryptophan synthase alpha chain [Chlorella sorokiniana]|eukprot:PRW56566.1 Tryptophan synthase alpha chain [Chlorella sorokiniana]